MSEIDDLRNSIKSAQMFSRGQYIEEGKHELEAINALYKRSNVAGFKETYIIEFTVLASTNPTHVVGSTRTYAENPANAGWDGRLKQCLVALCGLDPNQPLSMGDQDQIADMFAAIKYPDFAKSKSWPENFLKGQKVICEGMKGVSRKGGPVTNKRWSPVAA